MYVLMEILHEMPGLYVYKDMVCLNDNCTHLTNIVNIIFMSVTLIF